MTRRRLTAVVVVAIAALLIAGRIWPQEGSDAVSVDVDPATVSLGPGAELPGGLRVAAGSRVIGGFFGTPILPDGSFIWRAPLFVDGDSSVVRAAYLPQQQSVDAGSVRDIRIMIDGRAGALDGRLPPPPAGSFPFAMAPVPHLGGGPDSVPLPGVGRLRLPGRAQLVHAWVQHGEVAREGRTGRFVVAFRSDWNRTLVAFADFARDLGWESALAAPRHWTDGDKVVGHWGGTIGVGDGSAFLDLTMISRSGAGYVLVLATEPPDRS